MYNIKLKIHDESDLYDPYDPDSTQIKDSVVAYLTKKYQGKEAGQGHRLCIISDQPVDEERVRDNIHAYAEQELATAKRNYKKKTAIQIYLMFIGLGFITLWLILAHRFEGMASQILSIIGTFSIWEASSIWILDKPSMKMTEARLKRLTETEIVFYSSEDNTEE